MGILLDDKPWKGDVSKPTGLKNGGRLDVEGFIYGEGGAYHKSQAVTVQAKCRKTDLKKVYGFSVQGRFQGISASGLFPSSHPD